MHSHLRVALLTALVGALPACHKESPGSLVADVPGEDPAFPVGLGQGLNDLTNSVEGVCVNLGALRICPKITWTLP